MTVEEKLYLDSNREKLMENAKELFLNWEITEFQLHDFYFYNFILWR